MPVVSPRARARLAYVVFFAAIGAVIPYPALYYRELGLDLGQIGAILSVSAVIALVGGPAWGALSDRAAGSPGVLVAGTLIAAGGAIALAFAREFVPILACASLMAIGLAGITPIIDARALETSGPDRSGYAPVRAFGSLAFIVSATLTGFLVEATSIEAFLVVIAGFLLLTGLVGLSLRPAATLPGGSLDLRAAARLLGRGPLGLFLVGAALAAVALSAVLGFQSLRLDELGAPASTAGLAFAVGASLEVPLMLRFPWIAARFGTERLLVLGAATIAVRSLIVGIAADPNVLVAAAAMHGVGVALFFVGGVGYVSRRAPPDLAASAQGVFQGAINGIGPLMAGALGGIVSASIGLSGLFMVSAAIGTVAAAIVAFAVMRPAPEPPLPTT
jgi:PPP family 3-phenylpropionic acid transporter